MGYLRAGNSINRGVFSGPVEITYQGPTQKATALLTLTTRESDRLDHDNTLDSRRRSRAYENVRIRQ